MTIKLGSRQRGKQKMPFRVLIAALLTIAAASVQAAMEEDFRCLATTGKKSIALEFHTVGDSTVKWSTGYVLYKGSKQAIPIVLAKSEIIDQPAERPAEFEDTWVEIVGGKVTGTYVVSHQGANITAFHYRSEKDRKEFPFSQDLEHTGSARCQW